MRVTRGDKTLYHVQNMNICSDGTPYDIFLWADHEPTEEDIEKAFRADLYDCTRDEVEEMRTNSEVFAVYAEEL